MIAYFYLCNTHPVQERPKCTYVIMSNYWITNRSILCYIWEHYICLILTIVPPFKSEHIKDEHDKCKGHTASQILQRTGLASCWILRTATRYPSSKCVPKRKKEILIIIINIIQNTSQNYYFTYNIFFSTKICIR